MPRDTDRDLLLRNRARGLREFADAATDWATRFNPPRRQEGLSPLSEAEEFELLQLRRRAANLYRSSQLPIAAAVYGPSQVGKSLFVGRVLKPHDEARSPLGIEDRAGPPAYYPKLSFTDDLNPQGNIEATALVTRFTTKERSPAGVLPNYPVLARALSRADWLKVLARGSLAVGARGSRWDGQSLNQLFQEGQKFGAGGDDRRWPLDLFDAYDYLHHHDEHRFAAAPAAFYGLLAARPLTEDGYVHVAARLFWELYPELTPLFRSVCGLIDRIDATGREGILAPWAAIRFLLDSQRNERLTSGMFAEALWADCRLERLGEWQVLTHQPGRGGTDPNELALLQAALLEMVVPVLPDRLTEDWRKVLSRMDLLDLPGMRADQGGGAEGKLDRADTVEKQMQIVKRGKVSFLFDRYIDEQQIQTLFLLARLGNLEVRGFMKSALEKWGKARYGNDWPKRVGGQPALFVGLTGIDLGFQNHAAPPRDLFDNFLRELMTHLEPSVNNFGGEGKPFQNVYPIRYPGTMDQAAANQKSLGPQKWQEAGRVFAESAEVKKYVADREKRWQVAMNDADGGLSIIATGFLAATDEATKQDLLERYLNEAKDKLMRVIAPKIVSSDANVRRQVRLGLAHKVLGRLVAEEHQAYYRVQVLFHGFCLDERDVEPIADLRETPVEAFQVRTEELRQRLQRKLAEFLHKWAGETPERWQEGMREWPQGESWLDADEVRELANGVRDYLCSSDVLNRLVESLTPVIDLRVKDETAGRHARRKYTLLLLNEYLTNPGPDQAPLDEAFAFNGRDFGLMQPIVERWCRRLPGCLAEGAGKYVRPTPGNEELLKLVENYR